MDNVTHTLIGIAAAEAVAIGKKKSRLPLWVVSAVANNVPDLDLFLTLGKHADKLDYLLQHRGYTHTLLLAPVQGIFLLALTLLLKRKENNLPWKEITALAILGPFLHLLADYWNSYGVHAFWPLDNRWQYGDILFILEPWIWAILLPVVWRRSESRFGKSLALFLLAFLLIMAWMHPFVSFGVALSLSLYALLWALAQFKIRNDLHRIRITLLSIGLLFLVFGVTKAVVMRSFSQETGEQAYLAHPGNPFCWTVFIAGFKGDTYRASAYLATPFPSIHRASACPIFIGLKGNAPTQQMAHASAAAERLEISTFHGTRTEYKEVLRSCRGKAFFRFARIPFWKREKNEWLVGDLRFDRDQTKGFTELNIKPDEEICPESEPPWVGPFYPGA